MHNAKYEANTNKTTAITESPVVSGGFLLLYTERQRFTP